MAGLTRLILEHPQEIREVGDFTLRVAGLAGVIGAILYFAGEPPKKSRLDAPGRILEDQAMLQHPPKSKRDRATA